MFLRRLVDHAWFAAADLLLVAVSVTLWLFMPALGWKPLLVGLFPWLVRLLAGRFPFRRTPFDLLILAFLLTARVGVWAAYNPANAWEKFWLLVGGVLLYYALAGQPARNAWGIAGFLSLVGAGIAVYFMLTNDWQQYPSKIGLINRLGLAWMQVRPALMIPSSHPNNIAGVIAFTLPFLLALGFKAREEKKIMLGVWVLAAGGLSGIGFLFASSRGALIGLVCGLLLWLLCAFFRPLKAFLQRLVHSSSRLILSVLIILLVGAGLLAAWRMLIAIPSALSRMTLQAGALSLIREFPFTGGGLSSFPGLYSAYVLQMPAYFILNSHNVFLDVTLEQGLLGGLAFAAVYLACIGWAFSRAQSAPRSYLVGAALAGLVVVVVHGLGDNIIYDPGSAPLVFFLPGVACAILRSEPSLHPANRHNWLRRPGWLAVPLVFLAACAGLIFLYRQPLLGAWYADLGVIKAAQADLAYFPQENWNERKDLQGIAHAESLFNQATQQDARQPAASYQLGLIAMDRRKYPEAVALLENAYRAFPTHRGIIKALGYGYVWNGQLDQAAPLLAQVPEASYELGIYSWWWGKQGREDLSTQAADMVRRLAAIQ
jgi:hypothetical protein